MIAATREFSSAAIKNIACYTDRCIKLTTQIWAIFSIQLRTSKFKVNHRRLFRNFVTSHIITRRSAALNFNSSNKEHLQEQCNKNFLNKILAIWQHSYLLPVRTTFILYGSYKVPFKFYSGFNCDAFSVIFYTTLSPFYTFCLRRS